jgi:hypothetical protein
VAGGRYIADSDGAAQRGIVVPGQALRALRTSEQVLRFGQKGRSRSGQPHAARIAYQKLHANFIFQLLDLHREWRLGYEKFLGRTRDAAHFSDGNKVA